MQRAWRILAVDDTPQNLKVLDAMLTPRGYTLLTARSGEEALAMIETAAPDLVLLDVVMPGLSGYDVAQRLRATPATHFLPIVMITALQAQEEKVKAIEAGADDFLTKPINQSELLARVRSLLRIKDYHDQIERQAAQLAEWNRTLEQRVQQQVEELDRVGRLRRFLAPQLADMIASGQETLLESHRREIVVVFCDLRGFTAFSETTEPEEVIHVLREYHAAMGELIFRYEATLEYIAADGLMVFFNDPFPCPAPAEAAIQMAVAMQARVQDLKVGWQKRGYSLDCGIGISMGYATLGTVGFDGCSHYGAIGSIVNLASRLCDEAPGGQILMSQRVASVVEPMADLERVGALSLKGFSRPVVAYSLVRLAP